MERFERKGPLGRGRHTCADNAVCESELSRSGGADSAGHIMNREVYWIWRDERLTGRQLKLICSEVSLMWLLYTSPSTVSFLSWPRARHLFRIESLHPPGHLVPAVVLGGTIERTRVFTLKDSEFCPYSLACSVGLSELGAVIFLNGINRLHFVIETRYVLYEVETEFMYVFISRLILCVRGLVVRCSHAC